MNTTDESFFKKFKQSKKNKMNSMNAKGPINRTPITGRPLNTSQYQMASYTIPDEKNKEKFTIPIEEGPTMMSLAIDAILGAIIMFLVTSEASKGILSKYIAGFYISMEQQYDINTYDVNRGVRLIKSKHMVSMKGKLFMMGLYVVLFLIIKTWFIID